MDETQQPKSSETQPEQQLAQEPALREHDKDALKEFTNLDEEHIYAAMCYLFVLVFVPILTRKQDPFINFHARQGLVIVVGVILSAVIAMWTSWLGSIIFLLLLIADVIALIQAMQGHTWKIPLLGTLAEKFKI